MLASSVIHTLYVIYLQSPGVWVGLKRTSGTLSWTDDTPLKYTNWGSGQPDNYHGVEDCCHLRSLTGEWNDLGCGTRLPYLCQVAPNRI